MTFLYSSIGILLFSSIFLISKNTLLFAGRNYYSKYYNSEYIGSRSQQVDKFILKILYEKNINLGFNDDICFNLKSKLHNSGLIDKKNFNYIVFPKSFSTHKSLINSCILTNGSHRILIRRKNHDYKKYSLNSCLLSKSQYCLFEKNN